MNSESNQSESMIEERLDGQMSFLEHFDEFRSRLVRSLLFVGVAFIGCWFVSAEIYNFLSIPVKKALTEVQRREIQVKNGLTGNETIGRLKDLSKGDKGKYVFDRSTNIGVAVVPAGTSIQAVVGENNEGKRSLFSDEQIITQNGIIPEGIKLPVDFDVTESESRDATEKMIVTTAQGPFTLYLTVSLYAAIALSMPFLLLQIWGFISPALYKRERKYVTPFVLLSSISFVIGIAFAYYILFPPAVRYLLGLGSDFNILLQASDYFDLIILIMLAMGIIFQMPAIAYVLSRIGIVSAGFLIRSWKIALVVMLIVAAFVSPTGDVINLMLFATPMFALYAVSIFVAWVFGKKREVDAE